MDGSYLTNPLIFLVKILFGAFTLLVLLRFLLQLLRADFYNPLSQFVVKATSPVLRPLRRFIPGMAGLDIASLVLMWALKSIELILVIALHGAGFTPLAAMAAAIPALVELAINLFLIAVFIQVILSWVNPGSYNPAISLLYSFTEPMLRPTRRLIPPVAGLDFSPMVVMIGLILLKFLLLPPLHWLFGGGVY